MAIDYTKRPSSSGGGSPTPAPTPADRPVSLSKVTLTKSSPTISLSKQGSATGRLHVNLNWTARPAQAEQPKGFLKRMAAAAQPGIDLDLGCLFELADGRKGVIQALGNAFGSLEAPPYVFLDGDDRSGNSSNGENLYINLAHAREIKRVLVFACIYSGVPAFEQANGVVTLTPATGAPIEVRLDDTAGRAPMCAVALLENNGGELTVRREVNYINGAQDALDRAYGWGMDWTPGRK